MEKYDDEKGFWRTIRGRRVFIREGESLGSAMSRSGKFKENGNLPKRDTLRSAKAEESLRKIKNNKKADKNIHSWKKRFATENTIKNRGAEQAEKNRIHEEGRIVEGAKTRVGRNWNKYSKEQQREIPHENIQKKLADYKAKKQSNNKVEKLVKKGNTYIPIRENENEKEVVREYNKSENKNRKKIIENMQERERQLQMGIRQSLGEKGEEEVADALKRRKRLVKYVVNNRELLNELGKDYEEKYKNNRKEMDKELLNKVKNSTKMTEELAKDYVGFFVAKPGEGSIIIAGGKNGEDVRVGKNGKYETIKDNEFKQLANGKKLYVGNKRDTIKKYVEKKKSNNNLTSSLSKQEEKQLRENYSNETEIDFGKIDYNNTGRKVNKATIEMSLKNGRFSASGNVWNSKGTDIIAGGQMIDELEPYFKGNKDYNTIRDMWKKYHLNDMHSGTEKQERAIQKKFGRQSANNYENEVKYLKSIGLYEDNGYKYGTGWLARDIPTNDLKKIKDLIEKYKK